MVHSNSWLPIPRTTRLKNCFGSRCCPAHLISRWYSLKHSEYGKLAVRKLYTTLDETFAVLKRLTDRAEAETTNLLPITLPANERSLAYVQAVLRYNLSPSTATYLVRRMHSEIRACLDKLESSSRHVYDLYNLANNRLVRVATTTSMVSASTMLTARIKLVSWLKRREGTWGFSSRRRPMTVRLCNIQRGSVFFSDFDLSFVISSTLIG